MLRLARLCLFLAFMNSSAFSESLPQEPMALGTAKPSQKLDLLLPSQNTQLEMVPPPPAPPRKRPPVPMETIEVDPDSLHPVPTATATSDLDISEVFRSPPQNTLVLPDMERETQRLNKKAKNSEICRRLEGRLVSYYDRVASVEGCRLRFIEDLNLVNELAVARNSAPVEISVEVYKKIETGKPYTFADYAKEYGEFRTASAQKELCRSLNGNYVSGDEDWVAYVEGCKLRRFPTLFDFDSHNKQRRSVVVLGPAELSRLKKGPNMPAARDDESRVLLEMDDDARFQHLAPRKDVPPDASLEQMRKMVKESEKSTDRQKTCKKYEGHWVSFFSQVMLVQKCAKRELTEFNVDMQVLLAQRGGLRDMSQDEYRSLPFGREITPKEALGQKATTPKK